MLFWIAGGIPHGLEIDFHNFHVGYEEPFSET
jgi:hypothetical protein